MHQKEKQTMQEISAGALMDKEQAAVLSTQLQKRKIVKRSDTCIILHAYYPETCEKILSRLLTLDKQFDLIVTIPYGLIFQNTRLQHVSNGPDLSL
jgi:lipopolysaccharide biosynthesis protein